MCQRIQCSRCRKPTWTGCGAHIEQALAGIPREARCHCREQGQERGKPAEATAKPRRLFGLF